MNKSYFNIYQSCDSLNRPPLSYQVREYLIRFITDNILASKNIVLNGKWNVVLAMIFLSNGGRYTTREIFFPKAQPKTIKEDNIKLYEIIIPLDEILESPNPYLRSIELMYEASKIFLTTTYKSITNEFVEDLWQKIDFEYLYSLPYPASLNEQKYVGDIINSDGKVSVLQV